MTCKRTFKTLAASTSALCLAATLAQADVVHSDDVIITGSLCVGFDCVNGESFGFDTIRLKENNLRIKAMDTSNSASFPTRDWQITFNDSSNGGAEKFSIDDVDSGRTPFTIEANAPSHALYLDDGGRLGLGTSTPVVDAHIVSGNTPTVRLDQNGTSGFTPQVFDVAANETNFFVRDATNGSTLPFRIRPGAPTSAIDIAASGRVGIGVTAPLASLHVKRTDGTAKMMVEEGNGTTAARTLINLVNNGRPDILLANSGTNNEWSVGGGTNLIFKAGVLGSTDAAKTKHFDLNGATGNLVITGTITTGGGTCGSGCDRVFDEEYELLSIEEHAKLMYANRSLPNVGPTQENAPINVSDKLGRILNELEHAHIYIDQMNQRLAYLEKRVSEE